MGGMNNMQGYSFGPPQNAVYGRGGVWSPGQGGGPSQLYQPMPQPWGPQGGYQNPVYGQGAQKQPQQQNARDFYNPQSAGLQMLASGPGGPNFQPSWGNTAQAMGAGAVPGMGPQAAAMLAPTQRPPDLASWTPPAAPTLNTSAEVQGAPAPAGPSRLEQWTQKYKAMGTLR